MRLPGLPTGKLQQRIVLVFLCLLIVVQTASYWFTQNSIDRNARRETAERLDTGAHILQRLLAQGSDNLTLASRVLAADTSLQAAIVRGDTPSVRAALLLSCERVSATVALFVDTAFNLRAGSSPDAGDFLDAIKRYALRNDQTAEAANWVELIDGRVFQIVATPMLTPTMVGWIGMAFPVGDQQLQDMQRLSKLDVALLRIPHGQNWQVTNSTLPERMQQALSKTSTLLSHAPQNNAGSDVHDLILDHEAFSGRLMPLSSQAGHVVVAALIMQSVQESLAADQHLKLILLLLSGLGVVFFGIGGVLTTRRITHPLHLLTQSARQLERGDYAAEVNVRADDEIGELAHAFETMRQGIQAREGEIRRLAYQDALTGLPNREQFRHDLRQAIAKTHETNLPCTVLLMDLDRFKHVNDVLGHRFGDRLLRAVAERLRFDVLSNHHAMVARLSADEFAVLLPATDADTALLVAQRILNAFEAPLTLDDHTVDLSAGIGVASSPAHGDEADVLLGRAELAMYAAKTQQIGTVVYHPGLDSSSEESLTLLSELRHAVDHHQLRVYLQPKVNLRTGTVVGAEALVRWEHPTRGMVPPMRFIPFAEQTGFVRVLTMWMLEQVAQLSQSLNASGLRMKIAVNLSTRDLMGLDLPTQLEKLLQTYAVDPKYLVLEITESAIMDDPQRALITLNRLHAMGLKLSIDDFGTGYSSLAYLKRLPVDELKIDRSFVMNMESDLQDAKIVYSTIELAHNLGLTVVAEGVESAKAMKMLGGLACDEAQGYFIAKPMPAHLFADWAQAWVPPETVEEQRIGDVAKFA